MQRFRQVLAYIEKHPEEWNQNLWGPGKFCGTSFCFAGHAIHMFCDRHGINEYDVMQNAALALGATDAEIRWIYDTERTLDDFRTVARRPFA